MPDYFTCSIMSVPQRRDNVEKTLEGLVDAKVFEDTEKIGVYRNARRALLSYEARPFHLVLQDDLKLCFGFVETVNKICQALIKERCALPVGLYSPQSVSNQPVLNPYRYTSILGGFWGPANLFPVELIPQLDAYCEENFLPDYYSEDDRWKIWSLENKTPVLVTNPALVQHLGASSSTIGISNKNKVTSVFADDLQVVPSLYNWSPTFTGSKKIFNFKASVKNSQKFLTPKFKQRI